MIKNIIQITIYYPRADHDVHDVYVGVNLYSTKV